MVGIHFSCAMCSKEKTIELKTEDVDPGLSLRRIIEDSGWIALFNGPNFDIYCSKRCAR